MNILFCGVFLPQNEQIDQWRIFLGTNILITGVVVSENEQICHWHICLGTTILFIGVFVPQNIYIYISVSGVFVWERASSSVAYLCFRFNIFTSGVFGFMQARDRMLCYGSECLL